MILKINRVVVFSREHFVIIVDNNNDKFIDYIKEQLYRTGYTLPRGSRKRMRNTRTSTWYD